MRFKQGFSLIELMVVVLIMSLFICITYPSYQHHLIRLRRIDGKTALFDLANRMEHYFAMHHTYEKASLATGGTNDVSRSSISASGWYQLSILEASESSFTLKAIPMGTQLHDVDCQMLTLNSFGVEGSEPKVPAVCWS